MGPSGRLIFLVALGVILATCVTEPEPEPPAPPEDSGPGIRALSEAELVRADERQRQIADLLFAGLQALDADRLLTPSDDNAHTRFQRVLAMDPDNEIALQGLQDIVLRYVELAEESTYQGLFEQAEVYLDRARFVDNEHPAIAEARAALAAERESDDLFFDLDADAVAGQTEAARQQLADIAHQAREHEAFFLITAPRDDQARWMYSVMREAVNGYRLRGNIELAGRYRVRLRIPE